MRPRLAYGAVADESEFERRGRGIPEISGVSGGTRREPSADAKRSVHLTHTHLKWVENCARDRESISSTRGRVRVPYSPTDLPGDG